MPLMTAPIGAEVEARENPSPTFWLIGMAVVGGAWWYLKQQQAAREAAEAEAEEAAAALAELQAQRQWESTEAVPSGPAMDSDLVSDVQDWAAQFSWGGYGWSKSGERLQRVEVKKATWVWETQRVPTAEGDKVRIVKGKDRIVTLDTKKGPVTVIYKASGQVILYKE